MNALRITKAVCVAILMVALRSDGSGQSTTSVELRLPTDLHGCIEIKQFAETYDVDESLNPFYLRGYFDLDQKPDYALHIRNKRSGQTGIAFCLSTRTAPAILGAGTKFNGMDDFNWMDSWQVLRKSRVEEGAGEGPPPIIKTEKVLVEKTESASAIIYWDGRTFRWYQQGD